LSFRDAFFPAAFRRLTADDHDLHHHDHDSSSWSWRWSKWL